MFSIDTNILLYAQNADCPECEGAMDFLLSQSDRSDVVLCELATVNARDFVGFGFRRVWNPLA